MRNKLVPLILVLSACKAEPEISQLSVPTQDLVVPTTTTTTMPSKDIFSQWDQDTAPGKRLPFTGRGYNSAFGETIFLIDNGTQCICTMLLTPNPSGTITFSSCSGTGCAGIQNTYTWTNSTAVLTLCEYSAPTVCTSYH
jgi:hypothetical protein